MICYLREPLTWIGIHLTMRASAAANSVLARPRRGPHQEWDTKEVLAYEPRILRGFVFLGLSVHAGGTRVGGSDQLLASLLAKPI